MTKHLDHEEEEEGKEGEEEEDDPDFDSAKAPKNQQEFKQQIMLVVSQHSVKTNRGTYFLNCILGKSFYDACSQYFPFRVINCH